MKITRTVSMFILLSVLLSVLQIGPLQAYNGTPELSVANPIAASDLNGKANLLHGNSTSFLPALEPKVQTGSCHFGITVPNGMAGFDLSILGIESYLDWGLVRSSSVASNIQYYMVLRVRDLEYPLHLAALSTMLDNPAYKGLTWLIGNEPDYEKQAQDNITAETYADRYYALASVIRQNDSTAKTAFGTIIQPTPIRLEYLDRTLSRLAQDAGSLANALALIDIYSIHAFNINELPIYNPDGSPTGDTGAGWPKGFNNTWKSWGHNYVISALKDIYDINIYKDRVTKMRTWMKGHGEQAKPLYVTEYGSLISTFYGVSEQTSAVYMKDSFDFMLGTKDPTLGQPADENRLVQKWMWFSLNDKVIYNGGSLYDPDTHRMTAVGDQFITYNPPTSMVPISDPDVYIDLGNPTVGTSMFAGNHKITVKVGNNVSSDRLTGVKVELLLNGVVISSVQTNLPRCSGIIPVSFNVPGLTAGQNYTFTTRVSPLPQNGTDINASNDERILPELTMPALPILYNVLLPLVSK